MRDILARSLAILLLLGGGLALVWPNQPVARAVENRVVLAEMFTATW